MVSQIVERIRTKLEHYYKEHPLAPSLQFGLRLYLK